MSPNTPGEFDDSGAVGMVVTGDNTEVAYNTITDNIADSVDFGTDGSAVEIYGGIGTVVHHNIASNNRTFTELGNPRSADTTYAYNQVTSVARGVRVPDHPRRRGLLRPGRRDRRGQQLGEAHRVEVHRLRLLRRLHHLDVLLYNNVLDVAGRIGNLEGSMTGGNNVYWRGSMYSIKLMPGDRYVDPRFRGSRLVPPRTAPSLTRPPRRHEEGPRRPEGRRRRQRRRQARHRHRRLRGQVQGRKKARGKGHRRQGRQGQGTTRHHHNGGNQRVDATRLS